MDCQWKTIETHHLLFELPARVDHVLVAKALSQESHVEWGMHSKVVELGGS